MAKKGDNQTRNFLPFTVCGTTFSGDPHTTLGNTLRNICYMHYYLRNFGKTYRCFAAGDDGVIICKTEKDAKLAAELLYM